MAKKKGINPATIFSDEKIMSLLHEFKQTSRSSPPPQSLPPRSSPPRSPPPSSDPSYLPRALFGDYFQNTFPGVVSGNLQFSTLDNRYSDCTWEALIPDDLNVIDEMKCGEDVLFILLVEVKESFLFEILKEKIFWKRFPCIIITTKGSPSLAASLFLRKLHIDFNLPVLAITDSTPEAFRILTFYSYCLPSKFDIPMEYMNNLEIKWLGLTPFDVEEHEVPLRYMFHLSEQEEETADAMLVLLNEVDCQEWVDPLEKMLQDCQKIDISALLEFSTADTGNYILQVYIPYKFQIINWD